MIRLGVAAAGLLLAVSGCGNPSAGTPGAPTELTVFAAASLTDVFTELGEQYEERHRDVSVTFSFGSSATLAQQLVRGAPADVYAAASPAPMRTVTDAGLADAGPPVFARNRLQIAVPAGNPGGVRTLADLARPELTVALCAVRVPCGAASATVLRAAGLKVTPDTYEKDVKAALTKVMLGEVDAALVYRTDVLAAGGAGAGGAVSRAGATVEGIDVPEAARAVNDYPITVLADAPHPGPAGDFVAYVRSPAGRTALAEAGFELP
ncbi:MAG: molybdate ABC transporter substrate-binding protein [Micromonosporaceae bacterium]